MLQSFDDLLSQLRPIAPHSRVLDTSFEEGVESFAEVIRTMPEVTIDQLAELIRKHPNWVPFLALCAGLTLEQLKNALQIHFGTAGWRRLAQRQARELITFLDQEYGLTAAVVADCTRVWTLAHVLKERLLWSRQRGVRSTASGRSLEDIVEGVLRDLGLQYEMRTMFRGRTETAPCDFAIPAGGSQAQIVGAAKGFDSTGSKLSDAVREVERMAQVRRPTQYVYAIVDGVGWRRRQSDLKRLWALFERGEIDGLYTVSHLDDFKAAIEAASRRLSIIS